MNPTITGVLIRTEISLSGQSHVLNDAKSRYRPKADRATDLPDPGLAGSVLATARGKHY